MYVPRYFIEFYDRKKTIRQKNSPPIFKQLSTEVENADDI